jgi:hypothetical protein
MANYYCDLSIDTRPGSVGTTGDPYGWTEFKTRWNSASNNDAFNFKGQRSEAYILIPLNRGLTLRAWDLALYGPWRLNITAIDFGTYGGSPTIDNSTIYDGIIFLSYMNVCSHNYASTLKLYNVFLYVTGIINFVYGVEVTFAAYWSTIICKGSWTSYSSSYGFIRDSVIDCVTHPVTWYAGTSWLNSVFTGSSTGWPSNSNCQFNWPVVPGPMTTMPNFSFTPFASHGSSIVVSNDLQNIHSVADSNNQHFNMLYNKPSGGWSNFHARFDFANAYCSNNGAQNFFPLSIGIGLYPSNVANFTEKSYSSSYGCKGIWFGMYTHWLNNGAVFSDNSGTLQDHTGVGAIGIGPYSGYCQLDIVDGSSAGLYNITLTMNIAGNTYTRVFTNSSINASLNLCINGGGYDGVYNDQGTIQINSLQISGGLIQTTPSWPAWNALRREYYYLSTQELQAITSPPNPGDLIHSGLWGETRLGIGAFNFTIPDIIIQLSDAMGVSDSVFFNEMFTVLYASLFDKIKIQDNRLKLRTYSSIFLSTINLLLEQFRKEKPNLHGLIKAVTNQADELSAVFLQWKNKTAIDSAYGDQLDIVGERIGQKRNSIDDDVYRTYINTKIAINNGSGEIETVILFLQYATLATFIGVVESFPCKIAVHLIGGEIIPGLVELVDSVLCAGVKCMSITNQSNVRPFVFAKEDSSGFTYDNPLGFGFAELNVPDTGGAFAELIVV